MNEEIVLYDQAPFKVTTEYVKNWRKTYRLKNVEKVEVSRNYWIFLPLGIICFIALYVGWNYINTFQTAILFAVGFGGCSAFSMGTLFLQSRVVSEPAFFWIDIKDLRKVRDAIDKAIEIRNRREDRP